MPSTIEFDVTELPGFDALLREHGVRFAYLFGSRADGNADEQSDIDIACYLEGGDPTDRFRRASAAQRALQRDAPVGVDVVVLNDATPVLRFEATRPSRVLFCDDEEFRLALELRWFREYEDYCYRQRQYRAILSQELEERRQCSTGQ